MGAAPPRLMSRTTAAATMAAAATIGLTIAVTVALAVNTSSAEPKGTRGPGGCAWEFSPNTRPHPDQPSFQHLWPDLAVGPGGLAGVAWMAEVSYSNYHIFYASSTDGGLTWSAPEQVDTRQGGELCRFVDLEFTPAGIPVVVWEDGRTGAMSVYLSRRDPANGGTPWTANVPVNANGSPPSVYDYMNASLAILDEERFFVAWTDWREGPLHQVYARATADAGATWGTETRVSDGLGFDPVAGDPCLIVDPTSGASAGTEVLYCVTNDWRGNVPTGRYPNVYFYRSTNGGATWSIGVQVNDIEPYYQQTSSHALVRLEDGTLTAGWLNSVTGNSHFRTSVSTNQGTAWSASVQVDPPSPGGTGTYSSIAALGGLVFAGFDLYEADWNSYLRVSADGGRSWSEAACRMDDAPFGVATENTVVAPASPGVVYAAFIDNRPSAVGPWKIYVARGQRETTGIDDPGDSPPALAPVTISCYPNPSRAGERVLIRCGPAGIERGEASLLELRLLDAAGRVVTRLRAPGGEATWDGRDARGRLRAPGLYWIEIASPPRGGAAAHPRAATRLVRLR